MPYAHKIVIALSNKAFNTGYDKIDWGSDNKCPDCGGKGQIKKPEHECYGMYMQYETHRHCTTCNGTGGKKP